MSLTRIAHSPYTLVVCEKPNAARRIAQALGTLSFKEISALEIVGSRELPPVFSVVDRNKVFGNFWRSSDKWAHNSHDPC